MWDNLMGLLGQEIPGPNQVTDGGKIAIAIVVLSVLTPTWLSYWNSKIAKKEVRPDGGSSMKDQVNRLADQGDRLEAKLDLQGIRLDRHAEELRKVKTDVSTFRDTLQGMQGNMAVLQEAQDQRRETVEKEQEVTP